MQERVRQPVRRWIVAMVAGALVMLQVVAALLIRPVPDAVVSLLGGPNGGVDRVGGLRVRYRPPAGLDLGALERDVPRLASIERDGGVLVLEFPGVPEQLAPELTEILEGGGLTMHVVRESGYADEVAGYAPDGVTVRDDVWRAEDDGATHRVRYLSAPTREHLERTLAQAAANGWRPAPGSEIAFERGESYGARDPETWRSHEIAAESAIDGRMIASAFPRSDPNTSRPVVLLDFTDDGERRFCEVTRRIVGHKLATVLGGRIRSAPIINGAICGGRASITVHSSDVVAQEAERDMLVAVLSSPVLPPGGSVESDRWSPPASIAAIEWVGRGMLGLAAGGLVTLLVALVIGVARPFRIASAEPVAGRFPLRRLVVTLLAPVALIAGQELTLPGINEVELAHVLSFGAPRGVSFDTSIFLLGVTPILSAFGIVELVALAIPWLRWRRHDPRGRIALGQAVAVLGCVIALVQGYFLASWLEALSRGGAEVVMEPGLLFHGLAMVTLAAGTLLLGVVAGMISEHGLGNGYGVLLVSAAIAKLGWPIGLMLVMPGTLDRGHLLGLITVFAIGIATAQVLRWQIAGGEREVALRVPSSGMMPLNDGVGLVLAVMMLASFALEHRPGAAWIGPWLLAGVADLSSRPGLPLAVITALAVVSSWLLSRPSLVAPAARRAGLDPTTMATWARATLVSTGLLVAAAALDALATAADRDAGAIATPVLAMIATAVVVDIIDDARAHRRALAPAGVLHRIQLADVVERALAEAGIPCHIRAGNLRTLLAFFGPWAPAIVLVPEALAGDARRTLDNILRAAPQDHPGPRGTSSSVRALGPEPMC